MQKETNMAVGSRDDLQNWLDMMSHENPLEFQQLVVSTVIRVSKTEILLRYLSLFLLLNVSQHDQPLE